MARALYVRKQADNEIITAKQETALLQEQILKVISMNDMQYGNTVRYLYIFSVDPDSGRIQESISRSSCS